MDHGIPKFVMKRMVKVLLHSPAFFDVMLLAGEEIPDLLQKLASEHPDTDELLRSVNKYHRAEEARHLAFARMVLPEHCAQAGFVERTRIRYLAPLHIKMLFEAMVHPGVYRTVGLPEMPTWRAAHRTPQRVQIRHDATRPILRTLLDIGVVKKGRVPRGWRALCGVDRKGEPVSP